MEKKINDLNIENDELKSKLEDCESSNIDNEFKSNYQSNNNQILESDNYDLRREISDLEDELIECRRRLRDCD